MCLIFQTDKCFEKSKAENFFQKVESRKQKFYFQGQKPKAEAI